MKTLFNLILTFAIGSTWAQISFDNPSFEDWQSVTVKDSIDHWTTSTTLYQSFGITINNGVISSDAHDGQHGLYLETLLWYDADLGQDDTLIGFATKENVDDEFYGFPYSDTVDALNGWYKCDMANGDSAIAIVQLSKNGVIYSANQYLFYNQQLNWTPFNIPLVLGGTMAPDTVFIAFVSSNFLNEGIAVPGSWLKIDDISFDYNGVTAPSPIPNHSFEDTTTIAIEQPTDWWSFDPFTYNFTGQTYVTKSTNAFDGDFALKIETLQDFVDEDLFAVVTDGSLDFDNGLYQGGTPFIASPSELRGRYMYSPAAGDSAYAILQLWNTNSGLLLEELTVLPTSSFWTPFNINISISESPDSARIVFFSGEEAGSTLWIDDLEFIGGDLSAGGFPPSKAWSVYPNPANDQAIIQLSEIDQTSIEIYTISGQRVFDNQQPDVTTIIDTQDWTNGVYLIKIHEGQSYEMKKLVINH